MEDVMFIWCGIFKDFPTTLKRRYNFGKFTDQPSSTNPTNMKHLFSIFTALLVISSLNAQTRDTIKYKSLPDGDLYLEVLYPAGMDTTTVPLPTALFFFGGGWNGGQRSHFNLQNTL